MKMTTNKQTNKTTKCKVSVLTDGNYKPNKKISIKGDDMFPKIALNDPDLLKTLPKHMIATTGVLCWVVFFG